MTEQFDVVVVGTGPGGYVCAIRAAQHGLKVAVVEKREKHGGTCLNIGCIPSKALLHATEMLHEAEHNFDRLGIKTKDVSVDLSRMMAHKSATVESNVSGVGFLMKKNKISVFHGVGTLAGPDSVVVTPDEGEPTTLSAKSIVLATGSDSAGLKGIEIDEKQIVTSTGALSLNKVPEHMLVVGAGVIGLELGSVWQRLGAKVTVVEFLDRILPGMDADVARQFQRMLQRQGFEFKLAHKVTGIDKSSKGLTAKIEPADGGDAEELACDVALIAIGRVPYTDGLGLDKAGVELDDRGRINTDDHYQTNVPGIYAIGDVIAGPMLAHKAEDEGMAVADNLAGKSGHVNYGVIPGVVYTNPEVATVGKTEEELKQEGVRYKLGKFPFSANGRAKAMLATDGFVKILVDAETDRVLGAHLVGKGAGEMIHEIAVLMEFSGSAEDLTLTCHAHPTMSEAVREAALACGQGAIHM